MKLFSSIAICILFSANIYAQEIDTSMKTLLKIDGGVTGIGLSLETPLSKKILFEAETGLGAGYNVGTDQFKYILDFTNPSIYASLKGKYYYNREKRASKGKGLLMNAGNFVGVRIKYTSEGIFGNDTYYYYDPYGGYGGYYYDSNATFNTLLANVHWGVQRQLSKHWMYSFNLGLGYAYDLDFGSGTLYPAVDIKFSYVLPVFGKK